MKKNIIFALSLLVNTVSIAQLKNPVSFIYTAKKIDAKTYELHISATIEAGWHTYSQTTPAGGPVATTIVFGKNPLILLVGHPKEVGKLEQHHEKLFGVDVKQFSNQVDFVQKVKLKKSVNTNVTGTIEFMVCNDQECLPPTTNKFSIAIQ